MNPILSKLMANKHTTGAGLFFILCLAASQISKAWFPAHLVEIDKTLDALKELAVGYGFLMASDGGPSGPSGGTPAESNLLSIARAGGLAALVLLTGFLFAGCASVAPGQDPLVVRTEQVETNAFEAFSFVVHLDATLAASSQGTNSNLQALHTAANWLRAPAPAGTNTLPRGAALIYSLDQVKLDYQAGRATSNTLSTVLLSVEGLAVQAWAWQTNFNQ